jgi:hypothetical protein
MDKYYYNVKAKIVEDGEEKFIIKNFKGSDLSVCRANAFEEFEELTIKFFDQVKGSYSPLETYIKISFIQSYDTYDFEDGIKIELTNKIDFTLYTISEGKIEKNKESFEFDMNVLTKQDVVAENMSISDLYVYTTEESTIKELQDLLANSDKGDRKSTFMQIECTRCGKKMEVENKMALKFIERKKYKNNVWLSCRNCIAGYFENSTFDFSNYEVYRFNGESVLDRKPDLLSTGY